MILPFGELFSGAGGLSLGALQARVTAPDRTAWALAPAWAIDADADACATYRMNLHRDDPRADVRCADVRAVDPSTLQPVQALLFGFPCNDFSQVGGRRGMRGDYGPLYLEAVRILRALRPLAFVAENVGGLRSSHGGQALKQVLHDLTRSGYRVTPHLYRFEEYGVPQQRQRIVIVGIRQDLRRCFRPPAPTGQMLTAGEALATAIPRGTWNAEPYPASRQVVERLRSIRPGENIWEAQKRPGFPERCRLNVKGAQMSLIYRRLHPDRPAFTIVGSGGGGTLGYHWDEPRPLTNRERARLQGFPDWFRFVGSPSSVRRQIGMAVPPPAACLIAEALLRTLAGVSYPSIEPNIGIEPERLRRGRPRRLEAQTEPQRAASYRARRVTENRAAATAVEAALQRRLAEHLGDEDLDLLVRFVSRTLGRQVHIPRALPMAA